MNRPFPSQRAFNFAAVSFAIQYYKDEQHLTHAFKYGKLPGATKPMSKSQVIRDWVTHFAVARNFTGFGTLSLDEREGAYGLVHDTIWMHGPRGDNESVYQRAIRVESMLRETLKIKASLLSATTKLLWLIDRDSIIYDGVVRKKLSTTDGDYQAYCDKWESEFRTMASGVEAAVVALRESAHLFPQEWDLQRDTLRPWFMQRTFDTLHWQD